MASLGVRYFNRFGNVRPGYDLVSVLTVYIPVTFVRAEVVAQQRKDLPLLEEFALRLVATGVARISEIARVLGVDDEYVEAAAAAQVEQNNLTYSRSSADLRLTDYGLQYVDELVAIAPVETTITVAFDRVSWELASYRQKEALTGPDVSSVEGVILRAPRSSRISVKDLPPRAVNDIISREAKYRNGLEVLHTKRVHPDIHRFLQVELLVYLDRTRADIGFEILIDGDLSGPHRDALKQSGELDALDLSAQIAPELPDVSTETLKQLALGIDAREVNGMEHWELLESALETAKNRLLLTTSIATSPTVSRRLLALIELCLTRGVQVHVAIAMNSCEEEVRVALSALQAKYPVQFRFALIDDVVQNVLIADESWTVSTFAWLGYNSVGTKKLYVRRERGISISDPLLVASEYARQRSYIEEIS